MRKTVKMTKIVISIMVVCACIVINLFLLDVLFDYSDSKTLNKVNKVNSAYETGKSSEGEETDIFSVVFTETSPTLTEKLQEISVANEEDLVDEQMSSNETKEIELLAEQEVSKFLQPLGLKKKEPDNITVEKKVCMSTVYTINSFEVYKVCFEYSDVGQIDMLIDKYKGMILKLKIEDWKSLLEIPLYYRDILVMPIRNYYTNYELMNDKFDWSSHNSLYFSTDDDWYNSTHNDWYNSTYDDFYNDTYNDYIDFDSDEIYSISQYGMIGDDGSILYYSIGIIDSTIKYNYSD